MTRLHYFLVRQSVSPQLITVLCIVLQQRRIACGRG